MLETGLKPPPTSKNAPPTDSHQADGLGWQPQDTAAQRQSRNGAGPAQDRHRAGPGARSVGFLAAIVLVAACGGGGDSETTQTDQTTQADQRTEATPVAPPPLPADRETVIFERTDNAGEARDTGETGQAAQYWGIAPGEPLPIMWEDLMPEGALEDLLREQEAYLAAITKRYQSRTTTLADADPFSEIEEGSELDFMPQLGSFDVVEDLDGTLIRIPGYVVPFDFNLSRKQTSFLFVPYMGACIHAPPPPPNQIIFVRADPPIRVDDIYAPYWMEGELSAEKMLNDLGDAAYALDLARLEPYPVMGMGQ